MKVPSRIYTQRIIAKHNVKKTNIDIQLTQEANALFYLYKILFIKQIAEKANMEGYKKSERQIRKKHVAAVVEEVLENFTMDQLNNTTINTPKKSNVFTKR
ncbi:unnamed protein product [Meganyctiphanes norvegica]|uniref:Centromere protein W n=1 Tax=Meganyctiphanes norvegica TaxID=48144 RepID=A0AAV2R9C1_MEGNR